MTSTYDFDTDPDLPGTIGRLLQRIADRRAAADLISPDGKLHISSECRELYDAGHQTNSAVYRRAMAKEQRK